MKRLLTILFVVVLASTTYVLSAKTGNKEITGQWKYEVSNAPYGYEKGTIEISEKDGGLVGKVIFTDGSAVELKNITYVKKNLSCGVYVEGMYITAKAKVEGKNMKGTVDTPNGKMEIKAQKQIK
ncbi:MAG: hypothetical protein CSA36_05595 [Draconibacterium sp.]|nr:MAG: hypothetical protein CSA36_05595 [Draconibacterium sp.]